jgi:hypothetical protein
MEALQAAILTIRDLRQEGHGILARRHMSLAMIQAAKSGDRGHA